MAEIKAARALYIKLGWSGSWEKESLEDGIIRFGYKETDMCAALSGDWDVIHSFWASFRGDVGTATRDVTQIRNFFEATEEDLWITFSGGYLWWCFAKGLAEEHQDGHGRYRRTVNGWHNEDVNGKLLTMDKLSGNLLKVQGFRGTICEVKEFEYLIRKINGKVLPVIEDAAQAEQEMINKIVPLMRMLTWQDFELLVDLVFSSSGWRRIGQVGKTQKTVDLELMLPTTGERAFVQVKSSASITELRDYVERLRASDAYSRMFFCMAYGGDR